MSKKTITWAYLGIALYTFGPFLCVLLAYGVAQVTGSRLDEGSAHPCVILGCDIGGLLYSMAVMGWVGLVTVPTGILGLVGLTIALWVQKFRRQKDGKKERPRA